MDSTITAIGNISRDPELRYTQGGQAVLSLSVAVNRRWQNKQTLEWEEQVSFIDVSAWGTLGENCSDTLTKGMRVIVCGRIEQQNWEDNEGNKRSKLQIVADSIGPDLRWATAEVVKTEKGSGGGGGGNHADTPAPANGARKAQGATKKAAPRKPVAVDAYDEEPF